MAAWNFNPRVEVPVLRRFFERHPKLMFNLYPPLFGAGIHVTRVQPDWKQVDVEMRLRWWNANFVGTHYGGSLYSMTDPFFMVMLIHILGRDYIVWDKSAAIRFRRPGKGTVYAKYRISDVEVEEIREALKTAEKIEREFPIEVQDRNGKVIAEVKKLLHFRKKNDQAG